MGCGCTGLGLTNLRGRIDPVTGETIRRVKGGKRKTGRKAKVKRKTGRKARRTGRKR